MDQDTAEKLVSAKLPPGVVTFLPEFPKPPGWRLLKQGDDGFLWRLPGGDLVVGSGQVIDGKRWVHLSRSSTKMPSWPQLVAMRDALLGEEVEAYQVCPPSTRYVNLSPRVLHLWACLDDKPLPDFDAVIEGIRTI